jgi:ribosome-associated heat shock protein Hsp15
MPLLPSTCKQSLDRMRLDKWLWAARFYKTRALAVEEIAKGRISVNGQSAKASRELKAGDRIEMRKEAIVRTVVVRALSLVRGPAAVAQTLYEETLESVQAQLSAAEQRRLAPEPAQAFRHGRPTKRDRRELAEWDRWSASQD